MCVPDYNGIIIISVISSDIRLQILCGTEMRIEYFHWTDLWSMANLRADLTFVKNFKFGHTLRYFFGKLAYQFA